VNLIQKQKTFARLLPRLLDRAHEMGFEVTLGEILRSAEAASKNAKEGDGIVNSLHCLKLAVDLNLFKDGHYLARTADHRDLGEWWEAQTTSEYRCCWGGRFGDGNHYSLEHNGVR
jgi:hypothetical protein